MWSHPAALDRFRLQGRVYEREFGLRPDFRAGLHCGPVAVGELGYLKKEIALIGDTMNAAARIVEACRAADKRVLGSAVLLERLATLPPGVTQRRLGELVKCAARSTLSYSMCSRLTPARGVDIERVRERG